ncbi:MAG: FecR domain-containing protein [bacterium]
MTDQGNLPNSIPDDEWDAMARYLAGEGTADEREAMRRMLEARPERAALIGTLGDALRAPEPTAPTPAEVEAALASVLARRGEGRPIAAPRRSLVISLDTYRARWRDARLRAAAAVLVVAGAGMLWRAASPSREGTTVAPAQFATAVGKLDSLTLADGSRVLLGPGSQLTVGQDFTKTSREVTLKGEARFDVVHDSTRPFIVHTAAASFRDVGTVFAVHSDDADGARIVVTAGAVAVEGRVGIAPVVLQAGDRAMVPGSGPVRVERASATSDDLAWTTGKLIFRDASVEQVTADMRRWYGVDLRVDSALTGKTVTATFERASAKDVGRIVAALLGGGLREDGSTLRIVSPPRASPAR